MGPFSLKKNVVIVVINISQNLKSEKEKVSTFLLFVCLFVIIICISSGQLK